MVSKRRGRAEFAALSLFLPGGRCQHRKSTEQRGLIWPGKGRDPLTIAGRLKKNENRYQAHAWPLPTVAP